MESIAVGIPTFNAARTLKAVLDRLQFMHIPNLQVIAFDDGSDDGTRGMLEELSRTQYYLRHTGPDRNALNLQYFVGVHKDGTSCECAMRNRRQIIQLVQTDYIFWLDNDVLLPPNAILAALEEYKKLKSLFVGIQYEPGCGHNHVMFGATIWKREDFLAMPDEYTAAKGCDCNYACNYATKIGRPAAYHPVLMAYHCKHL